MPRPTHPIAVTALVALSALALAGCSTSAAAKPAPAKPKTFSSKGSITVPNGDYSAPGNDGSFCGGMPGYGDIVGGAQVVVKDESGKTLAVAPLEAGVTDSTSGVVIKCRYDFELKGLPNAKFYSVHVGNQARGDVQFSKSDMKSGPALVIN